MKRKHQAEFDGVINEIISGVDINEIDVVATPGAGKSSLPIQACRLIQAGLADAILWVVPRSALQNQGERGFMDPFFIDLFKVKCLIRASTNNFNPRRGTDGFITTYQAIASDQKGTVLQEVNRRRYIVVLDEFHHLEADGVWHNAIDPIVSACKYIVKMTGTLGRGTKKPIAYINYKNKLPVFDNSGKSRFVLYSRSDALREQAILPIEFHLNDGEFKWLDIKGNSKQVHSFGSAETSKQQTDSLFTALNSEFFMDVLRDCVLHWVNWKRKKPTSKLLIVTSDKEAADRAIFALKKSIGVDAEIATSHDSPSAIRSINRFKSSACDCLVTIAMAYEGLDVPEISHVGLLTNIRSREWLEQCLARGVRIDKAAGNYDTQMCHVFAPMDKRLKKVVNLIKQEQLSAIEYFSEISAEYEPEEEEVVEEDLFPEMSDPKPKIEPISSKLTNKEKLLLGIVSGQVNNNIRNIPLKTIKEQEVELRQRIHKHINVFCAENRYRQERINSELKIKAGKARDLMSLNELRKLSVYIEKYYPINGSIIGRVDGVSPQRIRKKRASRKVEKWTTRSEILEKYNINPIKDLLKNAN